MKKIPPLKPRKNHPNVLPLEGEIDLHVSPTIAADFAKMLEKKPKTLVVDLSRVSYIDSSGLGELVGAYATGANQGAQIKLLNVQKRVHDLLQVTKLYTVFESFTSETAALQSFGAKAASV